MFPKNIEGLIPETMLGDAVWDAILRMCADGADQQTRVSQLASEQAKIERGRCVAPPRAGLSRYVGVTRNAYRTKAGEYRHFWRANKRTKARVWNGPYRPYTPDGEEQAGWDYANYMGLEGPILR